MHGHGEARRGNGWRWILATAVLALLSSGLRAEVWVTGPSHQVAWPEKAPASSGIWDAGRKTVNLYAARNEYVAFQIVFSGAMKGVNVEKFSLKGPGGKALDQVDLFREHYLLCKVVSQFDARDKPADVVAMAKKYQANGWPREFPEQLVPLNATKYGAPFDVEPEKNEIVWADVFVPEGAAPGEYTASFKAGAETLNVKLTVWNFTLPSVNHFPYWAGMQPEEIAWGWGRSHQKLGEMRDIWNACFQMTHNHRLVMMEGWEYDEAYIKGADRRFYDYTKGTGHTGPFGAGFGNEVISIHGGVYKNYLDLLKRENWFNRAFVYLRDEPNDKEAYDDVRRIGAEVKQTTGGKLMRMVTEQFTPSKPEFGSLEDAVDIFCSGGIPIHQIPEIEKKGKVVWTYNAGHAGGPYVDAPGVALRTHAWAGFVTGSRTWFFWRATYWVDKQCALSREMKRKIYSMADPSSCLTDVWNDPLTFDETKKNGGRYPDRDAIRLNGDGVLLHPGKAVGVDGPIATLRLKNCRQGATDFEYLYLLEKLGKKDVAVAEATKLLGATSAGASSSDGQQSGAVRFNNYDVDGSAWDAARIRLGKVLDGIGETAIRAKVTPWNEYPNPVGSPDYFGGKRY